MYVDDRLGRRSRARSGLDQLDFAEDLLAEGQNATNRWPPSHLFASYGLPRVVSELSDSQE